MNDRLEVRIGRDGRAALSGELDILTVPRLEEALATSTDGGALILEVADLTFIDSTGLRAIVRLAGRREALGPVILSRPTPHVLEVLQISGVMGATPNLEAAGDGSEPG